MSKARQTKLESLWRRQEVRRLRARQAAWRVTLRLARSPKAWVIQGGEVLLFGIKMLWAYLGVATGLLLLWCLATSTRLDQIPASGTAGAMLFAGLWLYLSLGWWIYTSRLPFKSPFLNIWRETYADAIKTYDRAHD